MVFPACIVFHRDRRDSDTLYTGEAYEYEKTHFGFDKTAVSLNDIDGAKNGSYKSITTGLRFTDDDFERDGNRTSTMEKENVDFTLEKQFPIE